MTAIAADTPMEEVVVTGEHAGPGMWQVSHPDHPGHALLIVGEQPPLPKRLRFRSQNMERVALHSQEILLQPGVSLKPDVKVGVFRMLTLVLATQALRKNPDKARLQDLIPPDIYARWQEQKIKIPITQPNLEFTFKTDDLRGQLKAFARQRLADEECFAKTVELTEALSNKQSEEARARAWATGDLAKLQELPPLPDRESACDQAIVHALAMATPIPADLRE